MDEDTKNILFDNIHLKRETSFFCKKIKFTIPKYRKICYIINAIRDYCAVLLCSIYIGESEPLSPNFFVTKRKILDNPYLLSSISCQLTNESIQFWFHIDLHKKPGSFRLSRKDK